MSRSHCALIVDDDPVITESLSEALEGPGFYVYTASDAFEAVRILVERPVDLIVADIHMPLMSGFEFARQAKLMRPSMHFIFMSGFSPTEAPEGLDGIFLAKPFHVDELRRAVAQELEIEPSASVE
jgi:DNA-binding response OmpR family regulator